MDERACRLRVGRVLDGIASEAHGPAIIEVLDGRIAAVHFAEATQTLPDDPSSPFLDFSQATAMPGLVDVHTHFTLPADNRPYEAMAAETDDFLAVAAVRNALTHLRSGVTTARDNGARNMLAFALRDAIERGYADGPRLLVSGRPITKSDGHFAWCNGPADDIDEIRGAVHLLATQGADHIKIMASGGGTVGTDPTRASYSVDELHAAVQFSHDLGKLTTAHCRAAESMSRAIEAGLDCMEHGEFLVLGGQMTFDMDLAMRLVDSGMYVSPTLQSNGMDTIVRLEQAQQDRELTAEESATLRASHEELDTRLEHVGRLLDMGLASRLVCGTDAGPFDISFGHMDYGIQLLARSGMTAVDAIKSATSVAADACGVGESVGRIAAGFAADILVIDGDPLADLGVLSRPLAVLKAGHQVELATPAAGIPDCIRPRPTGANSLEASGSNAEV